MSGVVIAETIRRHATNVVFVAFTIVLAIGAGFVGAANTAVHAWTEFISLATFLVGCQLIGPEFSSGTLQLILAKPINRTTYLLSRFIGVVASLWIMIGFVFAADSFCRLIWASSIEWRENLTTVGYEASEIALTCALLALFGCFLRSYFNVALYFVLQIALALTIRTIQGISHSTAARVAALREFFLAHPVIDSSLRAVMRNVYPDAPPGVFDWRWILLVVTNTVIALFIASLIFRMREVPYGAD